MNDIKPIFNKVYAEYFRKDYFDTKQLIKSKLEYIKQFNASMNNDNIKVKYSDVKNFFKNDKRKCFEMILKRIEEKKQGKHFPQREKFTHAIFKALNI